MTTAINPRDLAEQLGVSTLDLSAFLFERAERKMMAAAKIARNEPWYAPDDAFNRRVELTELTTEAANLMMAGFECEAAWMADHPEELEDE